MSQEEIDFMKQLYLEYRDQVFYWAYRYVEQEEAAENIVLKIFSSIKNNISILIRVHIGQIPFILCGMTRYVIIKYSRRARVAMFSCYATQLDFLSCKVKDSAEDPDLVECIDCIKKIPAKDMDLFLLYYDCGLDYHDISDLLDLSVTNVRKRIVKANKVYWNALSKKKGLRNGQTKRSRRIKRD